MEEPEQAVLVQVQQPGHVGARVHRPEDAADDLLLPLDHPVERQGGAGIGHRVDVGDDDPAALGRERQDGLHQVRAAGAHGQHHHVAHAAPCHLADQVEGRLHAARGARRAEPDRRRALELHRVDRVIVRSWFARERCRDEPSRICRPAMMPAAPSHRFCRPMTQDGHRPQFGIEEKTMESPGLTSVTPGPICSTKPAPSWPPTMGPANGTSPDR
jgi:hypothetical protein